MMFPHALSDGPAVLGVVIVNWRGADHTIECLESLLRCPLPMRVVVVENGSGDGSADRIAAWAAGAIAPPAASLEMAPLSTPPVIKPLPLRRIGVDAVGGAGFDRLVLIESPDNLGFAGGNNLGLRHLLADRAVQGFWLLNNDTVVTRDAPGAVLARLLANPRTGMCGTIVRHYWAPDRVQVLNGYSFNLATGTARPLGGNGLFTQSYDPQSVADATDFVLGASLCVSREFLTTVGLMAEDYFLYFEEMDWSARNRRLVGRPFEIGFAHGATIFHKAGAAIGSPGAHTARSAFSDYWMTRSRLKYIWRHHILLWPWHWALTWAVVLRRAARARWSSARAIMRAAAGLSI